MCQRAPGRKTKLEEGGHFLGIPSAWWPVAGFLLLVVALTVFELLWPLHRHAQRDERRLVANFGLGIINVSIPSIIPVSAVIVAEWAREGFGAFHWIGLPSWAAFSVTLLVWSLAVYGLHVLGHRVPLLWRVHRVHHADAEIDLSTGVRHHPLEPLYNSLILSGLTVLAGLDGLAIALYSLSAGAFALWTHANIRLPDGVDRALRTVLMTPAAHNLHHSARREETDSNYGDVLIIWDRLFGTYCDVQQADLPRVRIGLGDAFDPRAGHLFDQLRLPLKAAPSAPRSES